MAASGLSATIQPSTHSFLPALCTAPVFRIMPHGHIDLCSVLHQPCIEPASAHSHTKKAFSRCHRSSDGVLFLPGLIIRNNTFVEDAMCMPWICTRNQCLARTVSLLHLESMKHHGYSLSLAPFLLGIMGTAGMKINCMNEVNHILDIASTYPRTGNSSDKVNCLDGVTLTAARDMWAPKIPNNVR